MVKIMITASVFSCVTNVPKLMIDLGVNQLTGRLLYPLSDGFLNEAVTYTIRLDWKKCVMLLVVPREYSEYSLKLIQRCGSWIQLGLND